MTILALRPPVPHHPDLPREDLIIGGYGAPLAVGAEVLSGIEAEAPQITQTADAFAPVLGSVRLSRILYYSKIVAPRDGKNGVHVRGVAVKVNRYDRAGPIRNSGF